MAEPDQIYTDRYNLVFKIQTTWTRPWLTRVHCDGPHDPEPAPAGTTCCIIRRTRRVLAGTTGAPYRPRPDGPKKQAISAWFGQRKQELS